MTDDNQIKELLQYNLSDEQIILKLQSNECTPDEITNTINTMKKIIFSAVFCNLFQTITYNYMSGYNWGEVIRLYLIL